MLRKILFFYKKKKIKKKLKKFGIKLDSTSSFDPKFSMKLSKKKSLTVGKNSVLNGFFVTQGDGEINIGDYCSFRNQTYIGSVNKISIGNHVYGAENVFISDNNNHPISPSSRKEMTLHPMGHKLWKMTHPRVENSPIVIEDNVWLGRNCMILKGVTIGEGSIVGAGSIVTKSFPKNSIIVGNPARRVKEINE